MFNCTQAQKRLNDFLDGALGASDSMALTDHLQECAACRREYEALRSTVHLLRSASVPDGAAAQARAQARFRRALAANTRANATAGWRARHSLRFVMAAGALCVVLLLFFLYLPTPSPPGVPVADALPTLGELDQMASLHAAHSASVVEGADELHRDAQADADSRLEDADVAATL